MNKKILEEIKGYETECNFIATIRVHPEYILSLSGDVHADLFGDPIFYDLYNSIINYYADNGGVIPLSDFKFLYREDTIARIAIEHIQSIDAISDLNMLYNTLVETYQRKGINKLSADLKELASKGDVDVADMLGYAESGLLNLTSSSATQLGDIKKIGPIVLSKLNERVEKFKVSNSVDGIVGTPSGFSKLDSATLGFRGGIMWLLAASTSDGKTQLAIQFANSVLKSGKSVLYFLLEDEYEQLLWRLLSVRTAIPIKNIMSGNLTTSQHSKVTTELSSLTANHNLYVEDDVYDINDIMNKIRFAKLRDKNLGLVVIDYFGLANDRSRRFGNREQELSSVSKKIVHIAKRVSVPILTLAQLNTNADDRAKGLPIRLNDVRDCKAVGHDARVVIFVNFPNKYSSDHIKGGTSKKFGEIIVAKNTYGETNFVIPVTNKAHIGKFEETN